MVNNVVIMGLQNTGTNLLQKIFNAKTHGPKPNGHSHTPSYSHGYKLINNQYLWKHTPEFPLLNYHVKNNPNTIFIFTYRNITPWLFSMKEKPYETKFDGNITKLLTGTRYKHLNTNIIHLYLDTLYNYLNLIKTYKNCIFVNYDKFSKHDYEYYQKIVKNLNIPIKTIDQYNKIISIKWGSGGKRRNLPIKKRTYILPKQFKWIERIPRIKYLNKFYNS